MTARKKYALGLMSGTSADGLSIAAVTTKPFKTVYYKTYPYSEKLRLEILNAADLKAEALAKLSFKLGRFYALKVKAFCRGFKIKYSDIEVIGSHGQTVLHKPGEGFTLQIGEASFIAEETGCFVVSDFRSLDMAGMGQGAPLIPFFDKLLFGSAKPVMLLNIGGISNISVVGKNIETFGFDIGPGNSLMDDVLLKTVNKPYDKDGVLAAQAQADIKLAEKMYDGAKFFKQKPPRSFDRASFLYPFAERCLGKITKTNLNKAIATLNYFTALTIASTIKKYIFKKADARELIVSGGGALNKTLMANMQKLLPQIKVRRISDYGINEFAKEPACFALLAYNALHGKPNSLPSVTGAKRAYVLGKVQKAYYGK